MTSFLIGITCWLLCLGQTTVLACGKERWAVKVGLDQDAWKVAALSKPSSIATLIALPAPKSPNKQPDTRYAPWELQTLSVLGTLVLIKQEEDNDYHIVLQNDQRQTMIVEAVSPSCAIGSRFLPAITAVRIAIDAFFHGPITKPFRPQGVQVMATGVVFFDQIHGQTGVARNGIELHPLIDLTFLTTGSR